MIDDTEIIIDVVKTKDNEQFGVVSSRSGFLKEIKVKVGNEIRAGSIIAEVEERFDNHLELAKANIWL